MTIIGLGLDMVELGRVERVLRRFGTHFLDRIMNQREQESVPGHAAFRVSDNGTGQEARRAGSAATWPSPRAIAHVAARFSAKEAAVKALGTGFSEGIAPHELEVRSEPSGKPTLVLSGNAAKKAAALGVLRVHLTLTHTRDNAAAVVILEG
ncbi:MAG: holo-ACP synthase [Bilophila sp.]